MMGEFIQSEMRISDRLGGENEAGEDDSTS